MSAYLQKVGTLLSQTVNALVLGGNPDRSVSARAWENRNKDPKWGKARVYIDILFGEGHCKKSFESDFAFALETIAEAGSDVE